LLTSFLLLFFHTLTATIIFRRSTYRIGFITETRLLPLRALFVTLSGIFDIRLPQAFLTVDFHRVLNLSSRSGILFLCLFFSGGFGFSCYGLSNFLNFRLLSLTLWWRVAAQLRFDLSNVGIGTKVRRFLIRFLALLVFSRDVALDGT
jgi:hypothetical protein